MPRTKKTYTRTSPTNAVKERAARKAKITEELLEIGVSEQIIQQVGPVNQLAAFASGIRWMLENFYQETEPEQPAGAIVLASENPPQLQPVYLAPQDAEAMMIFRDFMRDSKNAGVIVELMQEEMDAAQQVEVLV